jgi:hypothetical protein
VPPNKTLIANIHGPWIARSGICTREAGENVLFWVAKAPLISNHVLVKIKLPHTPSLSLLGHYQVDIKRFDAYVALNSIIGLELLENVNPGLPAFNAIRNHVFLMFDDRRTIYNV